MRRLRARRAGPPAPFVVGAARSGTTLLRMMLDSHRQLAVPFETQFLPELMEAAGRPGADAGSVVEVLVGHRRWPDFGLDADEMRAAFASVRPFELGEAMRHFYRAYARAQGKPRWGDKSPGYALHIRRIARLLGEAHFVHLIRDGRDVRLSQLRRGDRHPPAAKHARRWRRRVQTGRRQGARVDHYMEVRYESLIADPEPELRRICEFLRLEFDPEMLTYHERAAERLSEIDRDLEAGQELAEARERPLFRAGDRLDFHKLTREPPRGDRVARWKREMPVEDLADFERVAGGLLSELGYELGSPPAPR